MNGKTVHLIDGPYEGERVNVADANAGRLELQCDDAVAIYIKTMERTHDNLEVWSHLCFRA